MLTREAERMQRQLFSHHVTRLSSPFFAHPILAHRDPLPRASTCFFIIATGTHAPESSRCRHVFVV